MVGITNANFSILRILTYFFSFLGGYNFRKVCWPAKILGRRPAMRVEVIILARVFVPQSSGIGPMPKVFARPARGQEKNIDLILFSYFNQTS